MATSARVTERWLVMGGVRGHGPGSLLLSPAGPVWTRPGRVLGPYWAGGRLMRVSPPLVFTLFATGPLAGGTPGPEPRDFYGDSLPTGAVQRFGKLWLATHRDQFAPAADGKLILCLRFGIHVLKFDRQTGRLADSATLPTDPAWTAHLSADGRRAILFRGLDGRPTDAWEVWDLD